MDTKETIEYRKKIGLINKEIREYYKTDKKQEEILAFLERARSRNFSRHNKSKTKRVYSCVR
jgi:hypothetical protein